MNPTAYWKTCLDLVVPPVCLLCGDDNEQSDLCLRCDRLVTRSWPPLAEACRFCGMPRPSQAALLGGQPSDAQPARPAFAVDRCDACPAEPLAFDSVVPLAIYQGPVREAVVAAKLAANSGLATALGVRLAEKVSAYHQWLQMRGEPVPDWITYVPTSLLRRIQRGGAGGAACIAAAVSRQLQIPVAGLLRQTRRIAKQSLLPDDRRHENVRGAFALQRRRVWNRLPAVASRHILLIDDVLTTGSTAAEIAATLKQAGAASVHLAVIARAVRR